MCVIYCMTVTEDVYIYIYIYIEREREREKERERALKNIFLFRINSQKDTFIIYQEV